MSELVRILNRAKPYTSRKAALRFVDRDVAVWADASETAIRFREDEEVIQDRAVVSEMERDRQYWNDIARQRGGAAVFFEWRGGKVAACGDPKISRQSGYSVMGCRIVAK